MQRLRSIVSGVALGAMLLTSGLVATAQSTLEPEPRDQLAAVTPGAEGLPTGYVFAGETFLDANQVSSNTGIDPALLSDAGFVSQYVSVYENPDTEQRIRAYASLWTDEASAENGFALLEDESVTNPGESLEDAGTDVGQEPREITTGTYTGSDGATVGTADVTFRQGPMVIGVAHDTLDGSEADAALVTDIAVQVNDRAQSVLSNESVSHVDMALPGTVVGFEGEGNGLAQAGFLGPIEVESIYDVQGSLLSGVDSSWVETTLIGASSDAPSITIGISTFTNDADAQLVVEQSADLFPPIAEQEPVSDVALEGTDAVAAYRYSSNDDGAVDSYRMLFASSGTLTVIDVQRAATDGGASDAAQTIADAQLGCQTDGTCTAPELPASFTGQ